MKNQMTIGKKCRFCGMLLTKDNIYPYSKWIRSCRKCFNSDAKRRRKIGHYSARGFVKLKIEALSHYSAALECAWCKIDDLTVLSIDHINNHGAEHRKEILNDAHAGGVTFYRWLKKNNWPAGFQVLCMNCQWIKLSKYRGNYEIYQEAANKYRTTS